jgi:hypothetical protein
VSKKNHYVDFESLWLRLSRTNARLRKKADRYRPKEGEVYTETNPPQGNRHELGGGKNFPKRRRQGR